MGLSSYTVRESHRAKHVNLKISRLGKLEVIIPKGFDQRRIPEILQQKQSWIEKATERMELQRSQLPSDTLKTPPELISLLAIGETWNVAYCPPTKLGFKTFAKQGNLTVWADPTRVNDCHAVLRQWLTQKAQDHLIPWLRQISQEIALPFASARVRGQKTLWASCSGEKTISLNYKLLFLPAPLVRYVFIHELCHTVHLNHSRSFWTCVSQYEPDYKRLDKALNQAQQLVPLWVERSSLNE